MKRLYLGLGLLLVVALFFRYQRSEQSNVVPAAPVVSRSEDLPTKNVPPSQPRSQSLIPPPAKPDLIFTETLRELPTKNQLQNLSAEEAHHTPRIVIEAGTKLGQVAEWLETHPETRKEARDFYARCAAQSGGIDSIRALCYYHFVKLTRELGLSDDGEIIAQVPQSIRELSEFLD